MTFIFNINKAVAATGFLMALAEGKINLIKLVKMLYFADRLALQEWQRPITGDRFCSMDNGPVVSNIYDLIKGSGPKKNQTIWNEYFGKRMRNTIPLIKMPDTDVLAGSEKHVLEAAFRKISPMGTSTLIQWCHTFPEWKDPKGSSSRIDPKSILRLTTPLAANEIEEVEKEVDQANFMLSTFGVKSPA